MVLKGGSMKVSEIQTFLEESYQDPPKENILGYTLDEEISKKSILMSQMTARVYVKEDEKKSNCYAPWYWDGEIRKWLGK